LALSIISNNVAQRASRDFSSILKAYSQSLLHLSSSKRINTSADDPTGMAVSQQMRANSAAYSQGERNIEDAISLVQTATGSLDVINEKLILMKELAEEAATGTYTDEQRTILQSEFSSLGAEIDRIANATKYNGIKLLDGSLSSSSVRQTSSGWSEANGCLKIHFGPGASRNQDYYYISMPNISTNKLFNNSIPDISTISGAESALTMIDSAIVRKDNFQSYLGGIQNRLTASLEATQSMRDSTDYAIEQIEGVDIAEETINSTLLAVQLETASLMLAQANIIPEYALKLLNFD